VSELFPVDEITDLIPRVVLARRRRTVISLMAAIAIFAGSATLWLVARRHVVTDATRDALAIEAKAITSAIDAARHSAELRASRIATHDMVRAAIQTDAATAADLMQSDFDRTPIRDEKVTPGDELELFQLEKGFALSLARMPATAAPLHATTGTRFALAGQHVAVEVGAPVQRFKDGTGYKPVDGLLALSVVVDLSFARRQLADHAVAARLVGLDRPVELLAGPATTMSLPLAPPFQLEVAPMTTLERPRWAELAVYIGLALAIGLFAIATVGFVRR
jgi:hypothetical protein